MSNKKKPKSFQKKKVGTALGYRTPDNFKSKLFGRQNINVKFNPGSIKTQHRG